MVSTGAASRLQAIAIAIATFTPAMAIALATFSRPALAVLGSGGTGAAGAASSGQEETCMALGSGSCGGRRHHHRVRRCVGWQEGHDRWLHADHRGSSVAGWDHRTHLHPSNDIAPNHHSGSTTAPPTTAPPTTVDTSAAALQFKSGEGVQNLQQFTVPASSKGWVLTYMYNCSNRAKPESANGAGATGSGTFIVDIDGYGSDSATTDEGPSAQGTGGGATDTYHDTGTFALEINSDCRWTVRVAAIPK